MDASGEATLKPGKPGFSIGPLIGSGAPPQPAPNRPAWDVHRPAGDV